MKLLRSIWNSDAMGFFKSLSLAVPLILVPILVLIASTFWPVDIISGRTIVLARSAHSDSNTLSLEQVFVGDGYLTYFVHTNESGRAWRFVIDGDAPKAWSGGVKWSNKTAEVSVLRSRVFYESDSHQARDSLGNAWLVQELPEDGTKPFFNNP